METTIKKFGPAAFLAPAGGLTINADFSGVHTAIAEVTEPRTFGIFLNLGAVTQLDCHGVGRLVRIHRRVAATGRSFGLINVNPPHQKLLELLGLADVLRNIGGKDEALREAAVFAADLAAARGRERAAAARFRPTRAALLRDTGSDIWGSVLRPAV